MLEKVEEVDTVQLKHGEFWYQLVGAHFWLVKRCLWKHR